MHNLRSGDLSPVLWPLYNSCEENDDIIQLTNRREGIKENEETYKGRKGHSLEKLGIAVEGERNIYVCERYNVSV